MPKYTPVAFELNLRPVGCRFDRALQVEKKHGRIETRTYEDFVSVIAHGRNLEPARVRQLGDGRVYTGRQAQMVGLVNELGNLDDAVKTAANLGGISGKPRRIEFKNSPGFFGSLASMFSPKRSVPALTDLFAREPSGRLLYLYLAP